MQLAHLARELDLHDVVRVDEDLVPAAPHGDVVRRLGKPERVRELR